jgi:aryl-alcohol dehydrogenase-like predicted oxidoreductase
MQLRDFGATGLRFSALGFGAGAIGGGDLSDDDAGRLLNEVVDLGVTLIDTARSYGQSEERIGRHLAHRRRDLVLSTKGGYGVDGVPDWTYDAVARGIDDALRRLRTDVIDVFHLHSCDRETLARGDVVRALEDARSAGKIRVAAYSGENDALDHAVDAAFGAIQCSVSLADQRSLAGAVARAEARGIGVIAKRPIANAAWRFAERPRGDYAEVYWERLRVMELAPPDGMPWAELALRFSAFAPGVGAVIVGSARAAHVRDNAGVLAKGPLPAALEARVRRAFHRHDRGWIGQV